MSDDFKIVSHKRKSRRAKLTPNNYAYFTENERDTSDINPAILTKKIEEAQIELSNSDLYHSAVASLREGLTELHNPVIKEIICLGLGRIGECLIARYQLAFLLCLKELYNVCVSIYDPIFTKQEIELLENLKINVLTVNVEGKYKVDTESVTIFYLPHCSNQLSNNLLWANWGLQLCRCIIISNSFHNIIETKSQNILDENAHYIQTILPYVLELPIFNTFRYNHIFNDTAIHIFPLEKINLLSNDFWQFHDEPEYPQDAEFIKSKKLEIKQ